MSERKEEKCMMYVRMYKYTTIQEIAMESLRFASILGMLMVMVMCESGRRVQKTENCVL